MTDQKRKAPGHGSMLRGFFLKHKKISLVLTDGGDAEKKAYSFTTYFNYQPL